MFKFSSEYAEKETGLIYYNYRYYNPTTGKWISRDPIQEYGGYNLYCLSNGDSINAVDKLGLNNGATLEDKAAGDVAFKNLGKKLDSLCTKSCCKGIGKTIYCKWSAHKIGRSIYNSWIKNWGKGKNKGKDNVGGFLCWDWAQLFFEIGSNEGLGIWKVRRMRIISKTPREGGGVSIHFFARFCACDCKKKKCCIDIDDGWFNGDFLHKPQDWYKNDPEWEYDKNSQRVPPKKPIQPITRYM
ncbi:RHS repeat-associated core domain-containing protein [Lentisphaerae bacterium WC36]|nr:RHS repeat-associated core domain-containing protein [Lentisphaerae bacterium WC36]